MLKIIPEETKYLIEVFFQELGRGLQKATGVLNDMAIVRRNMRTSPDGNSEIDESPLVRLALARILSGRNHRHATGILESARLFFEDGRPRHFSVDDARKLFEGSKILRSLSEEIIETPERTIDELKKKRILIEIEQKKDHSLYQMTYALVAGRRIQKDYISYLYHAAAQDLFDRSATLVNINSDVLTDDKSLIKYILNFRDVIAMEVLRSEGELTPLQFYYPGAENYFLLNIILHALYAGKWIDKKRLSRLQLHIASPLEYFLKNGKRPSSRMSMGEYFMQSVSKQEKWFNSDPDIAIRSLYYAEEMAAVVMFGLSSLLELVPDSARDLEYAGNQGYLGRINNNLEQMCAARYEVVRILQGIVNYIRSNEKLMNQYTDALKWIERLVRWNKDALKFDPYNPSRGGDDGGGGDPIRKRIVSNSGVEASGYIENLIPPRSSRPGAMAYTMANHWNAGVLGFVGGVSNNAVLTFANTMPMNGFALTFPRP